MVFTTEGLPIVQIRVQTCTQNTMLHKKIRYSFRYQDPLWRSVYGGKMHATPGRVTIVIKIYIEVLSVTSRLLQFPI